MNIESLSLKNYMGATAEYEFGNFTVFAGPNDSGKSRIADAIGTVLAGKQVRDVEKKKDFHLLVSDGKKTGNITVKTDKVTSTIDFPSGQATILGDGSQINTQFMECCVNIHAYARIPAKDRRAFFLRLAGVPMDPEAISERMVKKGCSPAKVEIVAPLLRSGFSAAEEYAKDEARQEKANWRAVTGKTWSPRNGDDWEPDETEVTTLPFDPTEYEKMMEAKEAEIQKLILKQAKLDAALKIQSNPYFDPATQESMRKDVDRLNSELLQIQARCKKGEDHIKELSEKSNELGQLLFLSPSMQCPECGAMLAIDESVPEEMELKKLDDHPGMEAEEKEISKIKNNIREVDEKRKSAVALLAELGAEKLQKMQRLQDTSAKLTQYKHSEQVLRQSLDDGQELSEPAAKQIAKNLTDAKAEFDTIGAEYRTWEHAELERKSAAEKAEKAAMHHANVMQWLHIADALSSSGIPSQLVSDALQTVNAEISNSCAKIGLDQMSIESGYVDQIQIQTVSPAF